MEKLELGTSNQEVSTPTDKQQGIAVAFAMSQPDVDVNEILVRPMRQEL
jgi:hypothetical protein